MNDSNFYKIDTQLYDLLNKHFNHNEDVKLDLTKPENLKAYFNFRNETINFIDCPSTATQDHQTIRRQQRARTLRKWF
jgi:hypothetical protein